MREISAHKGFCGGKWQKMPRNGPEVVFFDLWHHPCLVRNQIELTLAVVFKNSARSIGK
jgi:hypothetical protein